MKRSISFFTLAVSLFLIVPFAHASQSTKQPSFGKKLKRFFHRSNTVSDVSKLTHTPIKSIIKPTSVEELATLLPCAKTPISVAGGRFSQGGHIAARHGTVIDLTGLNKIVRLDIAAKRITVQAGARWRDIQNVIDPLNLSISIMQSYADFTVGGSLSVNVHARGVRSGSLISSVLAITIMLADGTLVHANREKNSDLFYGAIGGYGCLGIIVEATLQLTDNIPLERKTKTMPLKDYKTYFFGQIKSDPNAVFHNGNLYPNSLNEVTAVTWYKTDKAPTISDRLQPIKPVYIKEMVAEQMLRSIKPLGKVRAKLEPKHLQKEMVVWRNYEMSYTVKAHEPIVRFPTTTVLQEYFVPVDKLEQFVDALGTIIAHYNINMLNISIRYVPKDSQSVLAYARQDSFALVLYFNMPNTWWGKRKAQRWTQRLIGRALRMGGTYYLPYQLYATKNQFKKAYPRYEEFLNIKKKYDPAGIFSNELFAMYFF